MLGCHSKSLKIAGNNGRSDRIRTYDPLVPNKGACRNALCLLRKFVYFDLDYHVLFRPICAEPVRLVNASPTPL